MSGYYGVRSGFLTLYETLSLGFNITPEGLYQALRSGRIDAWGYRPNTLTLVRIPEDFWQSAALDPARCRSRFGRSPIIDMTKTIEVVHYDHLMFSANQIYDMFAPRDTGADAEAPAAVATRPVPRAPLWKRMLRWWRQ